MSIHSKKNKVVILGITGSIAAYKATEIASQLTKESYTVHAVLTEEASYFITPLTLQTLTRKPVITSLFEERPGESPTHIELADAADLLLIAPATANILAKLAHGLADNALTAIALATQAPTLVAPAMNGKMWNHPATQENVRILQQRGIKFIGPEKGLLACGYEGVGRLWDPSAIVKKALALLQK